MKRVSVVGDPKFKKFKLPVEKIGTTLLRLLKRKEGVEIYLVGDGVMKKNVLAFPAPMGFPRPDLRSRSLGEIYINPAYIARHKESVPFMVIHGVLHLLGYDHVTENGRIAMEKQEGVLLKKIRHLWKE